MEPISLKHLVTPKRFLRFDDVFGSLDRGCSLTKLLYVKSIPNDDAQVSLEMALFPNKNFSEALDWLTARAKEEGQFDAGKKLRATGVGGEKYKAEIEEKLKMEVVVVHEFISQQSGAHFLLSNFDDDAFCYPEGEKPKLNLANLPDWVQSMHKRADEHFGQNDGKRFPAIFGFCGSGVSFNKLNEDLSTEVLGVSMLGGKSFLGIGKLILGTNDYQEIISLAEKGFRGHVDTQVREMFAQGETSEYKMLPPDLPLFPFGKASDCDEANYNKEDLAASVIGSIVGSLFPMIASYTKVHCIRRVYLGGHLFSGKPARDMFDTMKMTAIGMSPLNIRFLSNGHTGCIGSLLISPEEAAEGRSKLALK